MGTAFWVSLGIGTVALGVLSGIGTVALGVLLGIGTVALGGVFVPGTIALGGKSEGVPVTAPFRVNSAVLLRYQIKAPPPMTATSVEKTSRMARQDFMAVFYDDFGALASGNCGIPLDPCGECAVGLVTEGQGLTGRVEDEFGVVGQEGFNDIEVFRALDGAGGVNDAAAGLETEQ